MKSQLPPHELEHFMNDISLELKREYQRIKNRSSEDPGTAGDEAEENWAGLLRNWLPSTYTIVTKGRLISETGETSPQFDILILNPSYPKALINKKVYLAGGVCAVFECKLTLRSSDLNKTFENA